MTTQHITLYRPGQPTIRYSAAGAQGQNVPAFGLVLTPHSPRRPEDYRLHARAPGELGLDFHRRVIEDAWHCVPWCQCKPEELMVLFTDALPSQQWRADWRERARLRWHLEHKVGTGEERIAFADKLVQLIGVPQVAQEVNW